MKKSKSNTKKAKKLTLSEKEEEKRHIEWEKEHVWGDGILLMYHKPIKYDYTLPEPYRMGKVIRKLLKEINVTESFKDKVLDFIRDPNDYRSKLESYMHYESLFGKEFFYGIGTLYRWRWNEQTKALTRYYKYISLEDRNCFNKLAEKIQSLPEDKIDTILLDC